MSDDRDPPMTGRDLVLACAAVLGCWCIVFLAWAAIEVLR